MSILSDFAADIGTFEGDIGASAVYQPLGGTGTFPLQLTPDTPAPGDQTSDQLNGERTQVRLSTDSAPLAAGLATYASSRDPQRPMLGDILTYGAVRAVVVSSHPGHEGRTIIVAQTDQITGLGQRGR